MSNYDFLTAALKKLTEEEKKVTGQKESVIKREVRAALEEFCRQDAEFAQAVVQGGSFQDCLKKVCEGVECEPCQKLRAAEEAEEQAARRRYWKKHFLRESSRG